MVVFPAPVEFLMGSPNGEAGRYSDEVPHRRRIGRGLALASKKVTVAQFRRFLKAHPEVKHSYIKDYSPDEDGPILAVTWYEAAQYCRWLSEQEGVPEEQMCYPSVADIEKCKDGKTLLKLPANHLSRTGYRLPSEAEWEYACRAGSLTSRFYGSSGELLPQHAWYVHNAENRAWPVGQKKPNAFGLFDMYGNTWDWCQEGQAPYKAGSGGKPAEDVEDIRDVTHAIIRVLRGGGYDVHPRLLRSANRGISRPQNRFDGVGLRLARTHR
jgi:formylglycine-generating enzyme required for sulfatase activity